MTNLSRNVESLIKRRDYTDSGLPRLEYIQDPDYSSLIAAMYSKAVDLWECPRGDATDSNFMQFWNFNPSRVGSAFEDPMVEWHRANFNNKLNTSPLLIIDETLAPRILGMHLRGRWEGDFRDFDPRGQVLIMNKTWIDEVVCMQTLARTDPNSENAHRNWFRYFLAEFRIVHMILHELAHLKVTYLGHGETTTPTRIRAANSRRQEPRRGGGSRGRDQRQSQGESGEFFERGFYGGTVDYVVDAEPLGDRGFPWIFVGRSMAYRADITSIANLMRGQRPPNDRYLIEMTETNVRAVEADGERPRIAGIRNHESAGAIMGMRARGEEQIAVPPTPRRAGVDWRIAQLQQIAASPIPSPV